MKFNNTKLNYEELKKDVKGIGKGLVKVLASTALAVKDAATLITLSPLRDIRDGINEKKQLAESETQEIQEVQEVEIKKPVKTKVVTPEVV